MDSPLTDSKSRKKAIKQFIANPSLGALTYQACALVDELAGVTPLTSPETQHVRDILLAWVEYIRDEFWAMYDPANPLGIKRNSDFRRVRGLGKLLHHIYANVRYLLGALGHLSPPALQAAVAELTGLYFPQDNGSYVCVVRPQWKYNLKYVPLSNNLREAATLTLIDPKSKLGIIDESQITSVLWKRRRDQLPENIKRNIPEQPARHLAIISFPGLDRKDSLLYPLIAHEVAHFIDFSCTPPLHTQGALMTTGKIEEHDVTSVMQPFYTDLDPTFSARKFGQIWTLATECALTCLRELLSDVLATRMMGLSFFVSQAEFLKTVGDWELHFLEGQPLIDLKSGYPNIRLRLSVIYNHLIKDNGPGNLPEFIDEQLGRESNLRSFLTEYLTEWRRVLEPPEKIITEGLMRGEKTAKRAVSRLVEMAVLRSLDELDSVARSMITDDKRAVLTPTFLDRLGLLAKRKPPICASASSNHFSEIMSAAWVYQLYCGEWKEIACDDIDGQKREYQLTCELVNKSLESLQLSTKQSSFAHLPE